MHLGADMMRDEAHDALAIGGCEPLAGVAQAVCQPVDPQPAVGIEHDLDDAGIFEPSRRSPARARCAACARRARALPPECKFPDHPPVPTAIPAPNLKDD